MLTQKELRDCCNQYINTVDQADPPSLREIAEEHVREYDDAARKQLERMAKSENWERRRLNNMAKARLLASQQDEANSDAEITEQFVSGLYKVRRQVMEDRLALIKKLNPTIMVELQARLEAGTLSDAALVQLFRALESSRGELLKDVDKLLVEIAPPPLAQKQDAMTVDAIVETIPSITELSRVVGAAENGNPTYSEDEFHSQKAEFDRLDNE